ncbi:hypothetical protein D3C87_1144730 [compost metagenome]
MRGQAAHQHLEAEQCTDQQQVFAQGLLRRREFDQAQRVLCRNLGFAFLVIAQERPAPDQKTNTRQQHDDADDRPDHVFGGRVIVDQRFVGPVVGECRALAIALGGGGPRSPEEKLRQLLASGGVGQGVFFHGKAFAAVVQRRVVAEQIVIIRGSLRDGLDAALAEDQRAVDQSIAAVLAFELMAQQGLLVVIDILISLGVILLRRQLQPGEQFAVQPVGGPVRRLIGTVTPDRAQLHAANALPGRLAVEDVVGTKQDLALDALHLIGNRWCLSIDLVTEPAEQAEGHAEDANQRPP